MSELVTYLGYTVRVEIERVLVRDGAVWVSCSTMAGARSYIRAKRRAGRREKALA